MCPRLGSFASVPAATRGPGFTVNNAHVNAKTEDFLIPLILAVGASAHGHGMAKSVRFVSRTASAEETSPPHAAIVAVNALRLLEEIGVNNALPAASMGVFWIKTLAHANVSGVGPDTNARRVT